MNHFKSLCHYILIMLHPFPVGGEKPKVVPEAREATAALAGIKRPGQFTADSKVPDPKKKRTWAILPISCTPVLFKASSVTDTFLYTKSILTLQVTLTAMLQCRGRRGRHTRGRWDRVTRASCAWAPLVPAGNLHCTLPRAHRCPGNIGDNNNCGCTH